MKKIIIFIKKKRKFRQRLYSKIKESLEKKKLSENKIKNDYKSENNKNNLILNDNDDINNNYKDISKNSNIFSNYNNKNDKKKLIDTKNYTKKLIISRSSLISPQKRKNNDYEIDYKNNLKIYNFNKYPEKKFENYKDKLKILNIENNIKNFENINKQSTLENKYKYNNLTENNIEYNNILMKNSNKKNKLIKMEDKNKLNSNTYIKKFNEDDEFSNNINKFNKKDNINNNNSGNKKLKQIIKILGRNISNNINYVSSVNESYKSTIISREYSKNKNNENNESLLYNKYTGFKLKKNGTQNINKSTNDKIQNIIFYIPLNQRHNCISYNNNIKFDYGDSKNINIIKNNIINYNYNNNFNVMRKNIYI